MDNYNRIKHARIKWGLTQHQVAKLCEVSINSFRNWESGVTKPNEENAEKLKKVLRLKEI